MKHTLKTTTFVLSFLIGVFFTFPILETANQSDYDLKPANAENFESKIEMEINAAVPANFEPQLKVFEVEDFFSESNEKFNTNLLETGEFSNVEDLKAKSGEIWLGLFLQNNGEFVLRPKKIKVSTVSVYDSNWKEISVKGKTKPLFLAKGLKNLKKGKVTTLFRGNTLEETDDEKKPTSLEKKFTKSFQFGNITYTLKVVEGLSEENEPILVLLLDNGKTEQIIHIAYDLPDEENYIGNLFWAGDLDNDAKLDFYMDFNNYGKGGYSSGLFLSSEAEKGKLVKEFNYFWLGGC